MKKIGISMLIVIMALAIAGGYSEKVLGNISCSMLRLHIIANSDSDRDHNKALQNWKNFGFDLAILQPNYYWEDKSWSVTCDYINRYDMGMELEFEGTHGGHTSILGDSASAKNNKARVREYMENAKTYKIYGKKPLVLYTGTNALYELATSEKTADRELYHEFGEFIINSPLK